MLLMRTAVLLYNSHAGRHPQKRLHVLEDVKRALGGRGVPTTLLATEGPGTAGRQAAELLADIVFACGGDGTVHEVLQGMAFHPTAALGILPVGTANILAKDLRLPTDAVEAALQQISHAPRVLPLGAMRYESPHGPEERYFLVMAGAGPDGELVRESMRKLKLRTGAAAYYLRAARLFLQGRFPACDVRLRMLNGETVERQAQGVMAFRVGSMGPAMGSRTVMGAVHQPHLEVTLLKPPLRLSMLAWLAKGWCPVPGTGHLVECLQVSELHASGADVQVQADGEWLGTTPMSLKVVAGAVRVLLPS